MSDGKTHATGTTIGVAISVPVAGYLIYTGWGYQAFGVILGALVGHICTPDLDQHQVRTEDESRMYRISPILGLIWQGYWQAYGFAISHRSWLSHAPVVGTLIRFFYLSWWVFLYAYLTGHEIQVQYWMLYAIAAWSFQDIIHLALDGFKWYD